MLLLLYYTWRYLSFDLIFTSPCQTLRCGSVEPTCSRRATGCGQAPRYRSVRASPTGAPGNPTMREGRPTKTACSCMLTSRTRGMTRTVGSTPASSARSGRFTCTVLTQAASKTVHHTLHDNLSPDHVSPNHGSPNHVSANHGSLNRGSHNHGSPNHGSHNHCSPNHDSRLA